MENNSEKNPLINIDYILGKLNEGFKYTEEAKDRDLVLVIGNTGVGKSTLCNYFLGHKMKEAKYNYKSIIETEGITDIKIGHDISAETLYAQTVCIRSSTPYNDFCLLDCAGFLGNRTKEDDVVESISIELAVRNAKRIKAILVLISFNDLLDSRVGQLRKLVKILIILFKDPVQMVKNAVFIITKKNKYMSMKEVEELTIGTMELLKKYCKEQSTRLYNIQNHYSSENLTPDDYAKVGTYFAAILTNRERIIFFDPLDGGESKKLILQQISEIEVKRNHSKEFVKENSIDEIPWITLEDFNFSEYCENRVLFNEAVYHRANSGFQLIKKICHDVENVKYMFLEIISLRSKLLKLNKQKSAVQDDLQKIANGNNMHVKTCFASIGSSQSIIDFHNEQIKSKEIILKHICERKENLVEELENIDNDNPLKFLEKYFYKSFDTSFQNGFWHSLGELWDSIGYYKVEFGFDTMNVNVPIIRVEKRKQNGEWIKEEDQRNVGNYKITYESDFMANPCDASVTTFIRTRDEAGNKIIVKKMDEEYVQLTREQKYLESEITNLKSSNKVLKSSINQAAANINDYKITLNRNLEKCTIDIEHCNSVLNEKIKAVAQAEITGLANLGKLVSEQNKYDIVVGINNLLKFPSPLVNQFNLEYRKFLHNVDNYRACFNHDIKEFNV